MKIPPVKGTRDFYPADMAIRNFIIDGWKKVSLRNGFQEYDGPIFEYLKIFQVKSGDEIVEQLFSLKDRGGRDLALRPEITPTLARMVNQQINSLPKPIKWFSVPRLFRAERPQRGRLREFFQWNIDIIGIDDCVADAETIFCALDYLQETGLTPDDIVVKISSRKMLAAVLQAIGIAESKLDALYAVLDKRSKLPDEAFEEMLEKQLPDTAKRQKVLELMNAESIKEIESKFGHQSAGCLTAEAFDELTELMRWLDIMGVGDYCKFDPSIVRGLAYYTGIVYEIYDKASQPAYPKARPSGRLRAIGGGGRYDDLLKQFGGPAISATGFGIGDCILGILLEEKGLLKPKTKELDYFVACVNKNYKDRAIELAVQLRSKGFIADFSYKAGKLGKQLKLASDSDAKQCIIIGDEFFRNNELVIKDFSTGEQRLVDAGEFLAQL